MQPAVPIGVRWTRRKTALREWSGPSSHDSYPLNDNWRHHWRSTTLVSNILYPSRLLDCQWRNADAYWAVRQREAIILGVSRPLCQLLKTQNRQQNDCDSYSRRSL